MNRLRIGIALLLAAGAAFPVAAQQVPTHPNAPEPVQIPEPDESTDSPEAVLAQASASLGEILGGRGLRPDVANRIRNAQKHAGLARDALMAMDSDLELAASRIRIANHELERARAATRDAALDATLLREQARMTGVARELGDGMLRRALAGGVDRILTLPAQEAMVAGDRLAARGDHDGAVNEYAKALPLKNALAFDPELFQQLVREMLDGETVGYAVVTVRQGQLEPKGTWANGTFVATPGAEVPASVDKEMNIASVTKPITATAALRVMKARGISIDDPIGPYLPWDWARGAGVDEITFRQLLTHRSGLANNAAGGSTSYDNMKSFVATDITLTDEPDGYPKYKYQNSNFGLFRVMLRTMIYGCSSPDTDCPPTDLVQNDLAHFYRNYVQCDVLGPMGLSPGDPENGSCGGPDLKPDVNDVTPTRYYYQPVISVTSWTGSDWTYAAGGGGWYFTARELAQYLAHLRYNDQILDAETRKTMYADKLGWKTRAGTFGVYRMHGGGLIADQPVPDVGIVQTGLITLIADFGDGNQASLMINSLGGDHADKYVVFQTAYDGAWVTK